MNANAGERGKKMARIFILPLYRQRRRVYATTCQGWNFIFPFRSAKSNVHLRIESSGTYE